jgi:predicted SprT family Zn-dependent metalloprotease
MLPIAERHARRQEAWILAKQLMEQHGLRDWKFGFNRRKRSLGLCRYTARILELSIHLVDRNASAEIRDTILHEIAHALVGPAHGHDDVWKAKCLEIGATPRRCAQADMPDGRWQARCPRCAAGFSRHRRPRQLRGWFCRVCGPELGKLVWSVAGAN